MQCPSSLTHFYSLRTAYLSLSTPMTPFSADHWYSCFPDLVQRFRADCKRSSGLVLNARKARNTEEDTKGAIQHREAEPETVTVSQIQGFLQTAAFCVLRAAEHTGNATTRSLHLQTCSWRSETSISVFFSFKQYICRIGDVRSKASKRGR